LSALVAWHVARCPWKHRVAAAAAAGAILLVVVGLPLLPELGSEELAHVGDLRVVGWNPLNALRSTVTNSDGTFHYDRPIGLFYALPLVHPRFVFPLLSPFVVLGAVRLFRDRRAACVLFVGWPLMVYVFLAGIAWENPRFALTYFPPLLVLAGVGLGRGLGPGVSHRGTIVCVVLALLGSAAWCVRDVQRFTAMKQAHLEAAQWTERATPENATIVAFGLTQTLQHYTQRNIANLYHLDPESLAVLTAGAAPTYLLLDPANVEVQWQGLSPGQNLDWLRTRQALTLVDRHPPWALFRIEPR
jgi:hypothetical protein